MWRVPRRIRNLPGSLLSPNIDPNAPESELFKRLFPDQYWEIIANAYNDLFEVNHLKKNAHPHLKGFSSTLPSLEAFNGVSKHTVKPMQHSMDKENVDDARGDNQRMFDLSTKKVRSKKKQPKHKRSAQKKDEPHLESKQGLNYPSDLSQVTETLHFTPLHSFRVSLVSESTTSSQLTKKKLKCTPKKIQCIPKKIQCIPQKILGVPKVQAKEMAPVLEITDNSVQPKSNVQNSNSSVSHSTLNLGKVLIAFLLFWWIY
ncbi:hypothetical protein HMI54_008547 [Coelomomyces lativittatus]|nr:hypothetical protein HMI56_003893 [Coelomomyces lativittatus]KAJ1502912.1 hypothetical protein HMI54_008547 [Coelomomyces lativittatus]